MEGKKHFDGLTNLEVLESRAKFGDNYLTPPKKEPLWKLFLKNFEDPIIRIQIGRAHV